MLSYDDEPAVFYPCKENIKKVVRYGRNSKYGNKDRILQVPLKPIKENLILLKRHIVDLGEVGAEKADYYPTEQIIAIFNEIIAWIENPEVIMLDHEQAAKWDRFADELESFIAQEYKWFIPSR